jgi:hypothetical protein
MEGTLAERADALEYWVIGAFRDHEDGDHIECTIAKLVRGHPDADGADDGYILRVLQHPDLPNTLPETFAYIVLALLSRRRGVGGVGTDTSGADQVFLGEMVRFLAHAEESPLQQCMMAYSALFPPPDLPRADLVLGGSHVAESLHHGDDHSKQKAARMVVRLHELYEEREPLAQVTEKVAEWFLAADDLPALVAFRRLVRRKGTGNMVQLREMLPGVSALDFGWIYESMVEDAARRQAAEQIVGLLGWGDQVGRGTDAGARGGSDADAGSGSWSGSGTGDDDKMEELIDAARAFEADKRWTKRPLNEIRFVPGAGSGSGTGRPSAGSGRQSLPDDGGAHTRSATTAPASIEERPTGGSTVWEELKKEIEAHLVGQAQNRAEAEQIMARLGRGMGQDDDGAHLATSPLGTVMRVHPGARG